jgi:hypothetical protein
MIIIEVPENPNGPPAEMRVFHDVERSRPVARVRVSRAEEPPQWHAVTGWELEGPGGPAMGCKVDDSGEGVAILVWGGGAGLRLSPSASPAWTLDDPAQWGAPFLLLGDPQDVGWQVDPRPPAS